MVCLAEYAPVIKGDEMASKKGTCAGCGKLDISLPGRGLCSVCYEAARKAEGAVKPKVVSAPAGKAASVQAKVTKALEEKKQAVDVPDPDPGRGFKTAAEVVAELGWDECKTPVCPECGAHPCECVIAEAEIAISRVDNVAYLRELAHELVESMVSELMAARNPEEHARMYLVACDRLRGKR